MLRRPLCIPGRPTDGQYHTNRGKGTPRRKTKKVHKSSGTDDKKLQTALKKLNVQPIQAIEEVNMFKEDGNVVHFAAPKGMQPLETAPWLFLKNRPCVPTNCSNKSQFTHPS